MEINRFRKRQFYNAYARKNKATKVHYGDIKLGEGMSIDTGTILRGKDFRACCIYNEIETPYFVVFNSHFISYDSKICRISMLEPVYIESEYNSMILTEEQCNELYSLLTENNNELWKKLIYYVNNEIDHIQYDLNLPVPDYRKLNKQS